MSKLIKLCRRKEILMCIVFLPKMSPGISLWHSVNEGNDLFFNYVEAITLKFKNEQNVCHLMHFMSEKFSFEKL